MQAARIVLASIAGSTAVSFGILRYVGQTGTLDDPLVHGKDYHMIRVEDALAALRRDTWERVEDREVRRELNERIRTGSSISDLDHRIRALPAGSRSRLHQDLDAARETLLALQRDAFENKNLQLALLAYNRTAALLQARQASAP